MSEPRSKSYDEPQGRFGTFGGVFTPCTLTILGVIMFLRFGHVVGRAGLLGALGILLASKLITTLTALSLSAVATNIRVRGGGAYYVISRSLGVEFGGSIGIVFFVAQAVSVSLYVIGFTEALLGAFPGLDLSFRLVATAVLIAVFACVLVGAGWAIRVQFVILALLGAALVSFFVGAGRAASLENLRANLSVDTGGGGTVFAMFALFFPAATGIMAGANMSGDLAYPGRAIPRGTLLSIAVTGTVYALMALMFAAAGTRDRLAGDHLVIWNLSRVPLLITIGVFAATLSSAIGSMMGAPRILQALARDRVFKRLSFFAHGSGPDAEPRRATALTFVFALAGVLLGDLDAIAPIITMFFLITYGYLNLATFYESITRNPSYRPQFRWSHWSTALLGAVGCAAAMLLISPLWAALSILAMAALHFYIDRREVLVAWGDVRGGAAFEGARRNLLRLEEDRYHPKNWRPNILALKGLAWTRVHLAVYGSWLTGGRGLLTLAQVIPGDTGVHLQRRAKQEQALSKFIREQGIEAFPAVLVAPSLPLGIEALAQCYGIGSLRPNTVLLGWSYDPERTGDFCSTLRVVAGLRRSMVLIRPAPGSDVHDPWLAPPGTIDVWWRGKANGHLMLLLAHLLGTNHAWRGRTIRLLRLVGSEAGREDARSHLAGLIRDARIEAVPEVIVAADFMQTIRDVSGSAAAVFLGFEPPAPDRDEEFVARMDRMMAGVGTAIIVWSAGGMQLEA